ncbi:Surfactin synthase thioesterase subunit [Micromonospora pallida]|uniref:Surfactin synthase thioesterase subunit n=1 Tax=Micromonospora pallida TaxID=145854 RepID=A0A1C6SFB3_9ACTN|nr:thioesterase domain-containing protein [Micromonospora pallida]SCL28083.1 Surfactin synthase thioesterase subunit [Micromonospora pallida]
MNWFSSTGRRPEAPVQLFCLPYAGAGASAFRRWRDAIGEDVEVQAVQLPGREVRIAEDPDFTVAEVTDAIAGQADRPYAIYGHSMGGRLGFDVVRELRRTGRPLPVRLYVGGARAPHVTDVSHFDGLSRVDDEELLRRLRAGGGLPAEILEHRELVELLLPLLRADFGRVDSYRYTPEEPLPVPIVVFSGRTDLAVTRAHSAAWERHTAAGFTLHDIDGGHFFLHDGLADVLAVIRADLRAAVTPPAPATTAAGSTVPGAAASVAGVAAPAGIGAWGPSSGPGGHRVPLGDTHWSVWRDALLRTTGFPADGLTALAAPKAAAAADDLLDGGPAEVFDVAFTEALRAGGETLRQIAADPLLREAVTWQNPNVLTALDGLVAAGPDAPRNVRRRDREKALLRYWQRYCGKNETVGFFGPSCWVTVDPDATTPLTARPGERLTRDRWVAFESWAMAAYADALGRDPAVRRWWPPMLAPHLGLDGRTVRRPGRPPLELSAVEAALLAACDGRRPAAQVVADPTLGLRRPDDGYALLERFVDRELITWDALLPVSPAAERVLAERIDAIGDEPARTHARDGLDRLRAAREAVAAAAGEPDRLRVALADLDALFTELTGAAPRRRDGQMYAGRTLCYEDTSRDLDAVVGGPLLREIAAPMAVLLQAARWLVEALRRAYADAFRELYEELRADARGGEVSLADLWFLAQGLFWGTGDRPVDAVAAAFAERWAGLFGLDPVPADANRVDVRTDEIADRVAEVFPAVPPTWANGRLHSPDLQICARDAEALARGEYTVVLGELHAAWASFDCEVFTPSHPDVARLRAALDEDLGGGRIRLLVPDEWPRRTSRVAESLVGPTDRQLAFAPAAGADPDRVLPTVDLTVADRDGELVAVARDGRTWTLDEIFAGPLAMHAVDGFKLVAAAPHTPRITLDKLVVARETWRTTLGETGLADVTGERERFLAVRRWRRELGLPEQVYVKLGTETKPCFLDLSSPFYASAFCSMLRTARGAGGDAVSVTLSEMLPTPDQAWVPDQAGRRYFSELRLHIVDGEAVATGSGARR